MSEGPKYLVEAKGDAPEVFETLAEARDVFDSEVERQQDKAGGDGWAEEAEYLPRLSVCYLLAEHGLWHLRTADEVEAGGDGVQAGRMRANSWDFLADGGLGVLSRYHPVDGLALGLIPAIVLLESWWAVMWKAPVKPEEGGYEQHPETAYRVALPLLMATWGSVALALSFGTL